MLKYHYTLQSLTPREKQVYEYIVTGNSTKSIAEKLEVGFETIKTHRKNIYKKFNVKTGFELVSLHHQNLIE